MKHFGIISFILIIGVIIISSFFFVGSNQVKDFTKNIIKEIILTGGSNQLSAEENEKIKMFFEDFQTLGLPHPIIEDVDIPYYDVFTPPKENESFLQYISVKYEYLSEYVFDTHIHFEYILYNEKTKNPEEIYFGKLVFRSYDKEFIRKELISIEKMTQQK